MRNAQFYLWSKKTHRILVLLILILGIIMISTGYMMHEGVYILLPPIQIRFLHDSFSILFSVILGIMALTGTYLFLFPYLPVKKQMPLQNPPKTIN